MKTVQLSEARRRLSDLVRAAERGESVSSPAGAARKGYPETAAGPD